MMNLVCQLLMVISLALNWSTAVAQTRDSINGTWVLDASATEKSLLRLKPFEGKAFFSGMQYIVTYFYEVNDDGLLVGILPKVGDEKKLRRISGENAKGIYFTDGVQGSIFQNLSVTVVDENNIRIASSRLPELAHLLWKRVVIDAKKTTPADFQPETQQIIDMVMRLFASD